jgi:hypothetical protein
VQEGIAAHFLRPNHPLQLPCPPPAALRGPGGGEGESNLVETRIPFPPQRQPSLLPEAAINSAEEWRPQIFKRRLRRPPVGLVETRQARLSRQIFDEANDKPLECAVFQRSIYEGA